MVVFGALNTRDNEFRALDPPKLDSISSDDLADLFYFTEHQSVGRMDQFREHRLSMCTVDQRKDFRIYVYRFIVLAYEQVCLSDD